MTACEFRISVRLYDTIYLSQLTLYFFPTLLPNGSGEAKPA